MSTFDELAGTVAQRLGNRRDLIPFIQDESDYVKDHVLENDGQLRLWFLLTAELDEVLSIGQTFFTLPSTYIAEYEDGFIFRETTDVDDTRDALIKIQYQRGVELYSGQTGTPLYYAVVNSDVYLFPKPNAVLTLKLRYYSHTSSLRQDATNPWFTHGYDLLLSRVGQNVATYIQNDSMSSLFARDAAVARRRLQGENIERQLVNLNASRDSVL